MHSPPRGQDNSCTPLILHAFPVLNLNHLNLESPLQAAALSKMISKERSGESLDTQKRHSPRTRLCPGIPRRHAGGEGSAPPNTHCRGRDRKRVWEGKGVSVR